MTREEKVKLLKDLQAGKRNLRDVFVPLEVYLLETEKGKWCDVDRSKVMKTEETEAYIEALRQDYHSGKVSVHLIDHEECLELEEQLEKEF